MILLNNSSSKYKRYGTWGLHKSSHSTKNIPLIFTPLFLLSTSLIPLLYFNYSLYPFFLIVIHPLEPPFSLSEIYLCNNIYLFLKCIFETMIHSSENTFLELVYMILERHFH